MPSIMAGSVTQFEPERVTNDTQAVNGFTGAVQRLTGSRQQYRAQWVFRSFLKKDEAEVYEFLDSLEDGNSVFWAEWPGQCRQGKGRGAIVLDGDHVAGANELSLAGFTGSFSEAIVAGDPIELGLHGTKARRTVSSEADGTATVKIWPRLPRALTAGTSVELNGAGCLWQVESTISLPLRAHPQRRLTVSFSAITEVIQEGHPLLD